MKSVPEELVLLMLEISVRYFIFYLQFYIGSRKMVLFQKVRESVVLKEIDYQLETRTRKSYIEELVKLFAEGKLNK